jgi:DNA-binding HxlR family transcriptional regulator
MYHIRVHPDFKLTAYTGAVTAESSQPRACSIARTLDIVGEKWALLALREVFLGNRRFDEMIRRTGAPRDTLAARLRTLVASGILERRQYSEHPARYEYRLTEAGRDLYPVIVTLMSWGDKYLAGEDGPPMVLDHHCGHRLVAELVCQSCGDRVDARDTTRFPREPDARPPHDHAPAESR